MKPATRNLLSGLTALAGLAGLIWLVLVFGRLPNWVSDRYIVHVDLPTAAGLAASSRVKLNGIDIGYIETIALKDDPTLGVKLTCSIDPQYRIPVNVRAKVATGIFGGSAVLSFVTTESPEGESQYLARDGTAHISGDTSSMAQRFEKMFSKRLEAFDELASTYTDLGRRLRELLDEQDLAAVDAGELSPNLYTVIARADANLADLRQTIAAISELVTDETLRADVRATAANARQLTDSARRFTDSAQSQFEQLARRYIDLADQLSVTLEQVDAMVTRASSGQGTVGKMLNDPSLYNSLEDAAGRLGLALRELQLLLEKWKAEGLPVQF
jgi:phospholipid/cholesterol/gamma-HCH transport system substrate-binding protein